MGHEIPRHDCSEVGSLCASTKSSTSGTTLADSSMCQPALRCVTILNWLSNRLSPGRASSLRRGRDGGPHRSRRAVREESNVGPGTRPREKAEICSPGSAVIDPFGSAHQSVVRRLMPDTPGPFVADLVGRHAITTLKTGYAGPLTAMGARRARLPQASSEADQAVAATRRQYRLRSRRGRRAAGAHRHRPRDDQVRCR